MTPEDDAKIRYYCEKYWGIGNIEKEIPGEVLQWLGCEAPKMLVHIGQQAAQITALKEIVVEKFAESLYNSTYNVDGIGRYFHEKDKTFQKMFCDVARQQLEAEHPEEMK